VEARQSLAGIALLGLTAGLAEPALAQNAASIPVAVRIAEVPVFPSPRAVPPEACARALACRSLLPPDRTVFLQDGLVALVTKTIEPDRVRVRLEYVGN
jgi:hypothetical protein